jgi:tetratricopeptide (TPR) repeat protein
MLSEKDTLVLADFENTTGDAVFDGTLRQGLSVELEQTPFLQLVSDGQIRQTLRLMEKPPDTRLTPGVAREVCRRANATADIEGSIAALGNEYVIGLSAVDCRSGETLAREQVSASGKESVLNALGSAASELRAKLGETRASLEKFDTPLEQATTPSLEALRAYTLGRRAMDGFDVVQAPSFFLQAIRLDPNFAMAYARLGTSYINLGELGLGAGYIRQAYQMHERVSEPEKLYIDSHFYQFVTGDLEKARQVYELWAQTYRQDWTPRINLGEDDEAMGQYDKSLEEYRETLRLRPNAMVYESLANSYLHLNRLEEARSAVKQALANKLDSPSQHLLLYRLAFLQRDPAGMTEESDWAAGQPGVEDLLLSSQADTAAFYGRLGEARNLSRLAVASAERAEQREMAAAFEANAALREALFGSATEARKRSAAALSLSDNRDVQFEAGLALAFLGDGVRAQHLADDLDRRFPEDTVAHCNYLPSIRAVLALNNKDSSRAIEILGTAAPCELGMSDVEESPAALYPAYVRGEAYLAAHQGKEAAVEFQKILDHSGIVLDESIAALAHVGLARAYALAGETAKEKAAYQDFFALWKNADPDIPILRQARADFEKLQ